MKTQQERLREIEELAHDLREEIDEANRHNHLRFAHIAEGECFKFYDGIDSIHIKTGGRSYVKLEGGSLSVGTVISDTCVVYRA